MPLGSKPLLPASGQRFGALLQSPSRCENNVAPVSWSSNSPGLGVEAGPWFSYSKGKLPRGFADAAQRRRLCIVAKHCVLRTTAGFVEKMRIHCTDHVCCLGIALRNNELHANDPDSLYVARFFLQWAPSSILTHFDHFMVLHRNTVI